jgi:hypothetical protein
VSLTSILEVLLAELLGDARGRSPCELPRCHEGASAATIAAAKRAKTDGEKKAIAACIGWKERVQGELKVLTDMKWADGMVEAARKNKEVVAVGIAAFSLGLLVSQKLFRK